MRILSFLFSGLLSPAVLLTSQATAQTAPLSFFGDTSAARHTTAKLLLPPAARPGDTLLAGVQLKMESGWHTYWKNPGAAGQATQIQWQLPAGVTAGDIQWPVPEKIPPFDLTTYGYENEVVLLVPLTFARSLPDGPLDLSAKVSWLECKNSCLPASAEIQGRLLLQPAQAPAIDDPMAKVLAAMQSKVPKVNSDALINSRAAWWEDPSVTNTRSLMIEIKLSPEALGGPSPTKGADFYPDASDSFELQGATDNLSVPPVDLRLRKLVMKSSGDWPKEISGVLVLDAGGDSQRGIQLRLPVGELAPDAASQSVKAPGAPPARPAPPLWRMLLFAFIGGLILNLMPCVLPVIALKILGFVSEAQSSPARRRALGGVYALGVLFSFLALAAVVIGVQAGGHQAGWGMQFGNPVFLVVLTTLVTLVALNLFGVFEVLLGGRTLNAAGQLAARHGAAGAFFNGVLATVLATPCTAPFLSVALGFAFGQSAPIIVLTFLTVGLGLASPYVLLSWNPAWLKWLPKPGAWMEKFKIAMGFPMLAAAVWLYTLAAGGLNQSRTLRLGLFLIAVAMAAWIWGAFVQRGTRRRGWAMLASVLLAGGAGAGVSFQAPDQIAWQPWSPAAVAQARAEGKIVLVDFTADWCLTCQVNKKTSLEVPSVREKLKALKAVMLLGDYTHFPAAITAELQRFDRAGVPLVLVYPRDPAQPPRVLPEILTPGLVLEALEQAAR